MSRLSEIEERARRGHEMACSDPADPSRTTRYSDTLTLVDVVRKVDGIRRYIRQAQAVHVEVSSAEIERRLDATIGTLMM